MYNTCVGETIPYTADTKGLAFEGRVLAVWPEDADIDLQPLASGSSGDIPADAPWNRTPPARVDQFITRGGQGLAAVSAPPCASCASLWSLQSGGWNQVNDLGVGADGYEVITVMDLDDNRQVEAIVYERWRNDYGLHVLGNDWTRPAYRFSCGNL